MDEDSNPDLPRDRVVQHLKAVAPKLVVSYLEYIISMGEKHQDFHNQLILLYLESVTKIFVDNVGVFEEG